MTRADIRSFLEFVRKKTLDTLDAIAKRPDATELLGWRPGPGRAHIAWQLMHIAATDDRHLGVRMKGGEAADQELVRRFAGGSTPEQGGIAMSLERMNKIIKIDPANRMAVVEPGVLNQD